MPAPAARARELVALRTCPERPSRTQEMAPGEVVDAAGREAEAEAEAAAPREADDAGEAEAEAEAEEEEAEVEDELASAAPVPKVATVAGLRPERKGLNLTVKARSLRHDGSRCWARPSPACAARARRLAPGAGPPERAPPIGLPHQPACGSLIDAGCRRVVGRF